MVAAVWFVNDMVIERKLLESEKRTNEVSGAAIEAARDAIMAELGQSVTQINSKIETQNAVLSNISTELEGGTSGQPFFVTVPAVGTLKAEVLKSPQWADFTAGLGIDPLSSGVEGQVSIPIEALEITPE